MKTDPHLWAQKLDDLRDEVWLRLKRGVLDRRAPARNVTLATVDWHNRPQVRTVVLRSADKETSVLDIHTDLYSSKVQELRQNPFAALHFWDSSAHLQVRLDGRVAVLTGADVADVWTRVPQASRHSYGSTPAPGQPIAEGLCYSKKPDPASFAVLRITVSSIDALHLGPHHRRAQFNVRDGWQGQWLAP